MAKKAKKTPKVNINPWLIVTVILIIALAGFIFYDKSPTFNKNVNFILGIQNDTVVFYAVERTSGCMLSLLCMI